MRRYPILILLMTCLLPVSFAQKESMLQLAAAPDGMLQLTFRSGHCTVAAQDETGVRISLPGTEITAAREGLPALPAMSHLLLLPKGSRATVENVRCGATETLSLGEGRRLTPWAGATIKGQPEAEAEPDKEVYILDRYWAPAAPVELRHIGTLRDREVMLVSVHPAAYNPAKGTVRLTTEIDATLTVTLPSDLPGLASLADRYLIVSRPEFREGLQPFVRWKRMTGYDVREVYAATADHDSVKAAIAAAWTGDASRWPKYLLIVGDAAQIEPFLGTSRPTGVAPHTTDLYYAEHTGDYLPDASFGRWPVNDTAELRAVVEKTLRYEQAADLDTHALNRLLVVAGEESRMPAPVTTNGQMHYVSREAKAAHPTLDTLCWSNPASASRRGDILHAIGLGAAVLNYTAHCTTSGWTSPAVSFASLDTLSPRQPMVYVNNCCESNDFGGTCFGEQLLRKAVGGAVGVVGATNVTLWNEDYYWSVGPKYPFAAEPLFDSLRLGAFDRWTGRTGGIETLGGLVEAGNLAVSASGSPYDRFYWEIYCLLGDPSLMPFVGAPKRSELTVIDGIRAGSTTLTLDGTPGLHVGLVQADSLLSAGVIPPDGRLSLCLRQSLDTGLATLTATGYGFRPQTLTLSVGPAFRHVGFHDLRPADSTLTFTLANYGDDTLYNLNVSLRQDSADIASGTAIDNDTLRLARLLPRQRLPLTLHYAIASIGPSPTATACLEAADTALLGSLHLGLDCHTDYPALDLTVRDADSNAADCIAEGQTYLLHGSVLGRYDSLRLTATPLPSGHTLTDTTGWLPFSVGGDTRQVHISADLYLGRWHGHHSGYLAATPATDGFEEHFSCHPWRQGGSRPWTVDSTECHSGRFSVRSGNIDYRQTSDLAISVTVLQPSSISFYVKTSCEEIYDKLVFSIDGVAQRQAWGETGWIRHQVPIAEGTHELRWRYVKDESNAAGRDCAWIDDVSLPFALWDSTYGCTSAGPLSVAADAEVSHIAVHPNPTSGRLTLSGLPSGRLTRATVLDIYGRQVAQATAVGKTTLEMDLSEAPAGLYLIHIEDGSGTTTVKVIINR